jgi:hypothetical protein
MPPHVPEEGHCQGDRHDDPGVAEKQSGRGISYRQVVYRLFDDKRDQELKEIHSQQTGDTHEQGSLVLDKVPLERCQISKCLFHKCSLLKEILELQEHCQGGRVKRTREEG